MQVADKGKRNYDFQSNALDSSFFLPFPPRRRAPRRFSPSSFLFLRPGQGMARMARNGKSNTLSKQSRVVDYFVSRLYRTMQWIPRIGGPAKDPRLAKG